MQCMLVCNQTLFGCCTQMFHAFADVALSAAGRWSRELLSMDLLAGDEHATSWDWWLIITTNAHDGCCMARRAVQWSLLTNAHDSIGSRHNARAPNCLGVRTL